MYQAKLERARTQTRLNRAKAQTEKHWEFRGANLEIQGATDLEILNVGAAGTGKSLADLVKQNRLMWRYPGARGLIVRKVRADLAESILVTFERDVLGEDNPICAGMNRENRRVYRYPNGSQIVVGGMDRPKRILSADYDIILAVEAVELSEEDWETLVMRCRNGVIPFQQVIGEANPDRPDHWLKQRCDRGLTRLLNSFHRDNPRYWMNGDWTAAGRQYVLGALSRLTGVRKKRYLEGLWSIAEGAVYDGWDERVHVVDPFDIPSDWRRIRVIDFGFTNPFVCQWWAMDGDGRAFVYREIYLTEQLVEDMAAEIKRLSAGETIEATVSDHDAEDRATLRKHGVNTVAAIKDVSPGIQAVAARLRLADDGKPRLFYVRGALVRRDTKLAEAKKPTCTMEEVPGYVWPKAQDGKPEKETPVKADDHGCDCLRYGTMYLDYRGRARVRKIRY